MTAQEILLEALRFYGIEIISAHGNRIKVQNSYEIEIESDRLYKLFNDGDVVAPFDDIDELCWFILE